MKRFLILTSTEDSASMNIRENFFKNFELQEKELKCYGYPIYKFGGINQKSENKDDDERPSSSDENISFAELFPDHLYPLCGPELG